MPFYSRIFQLAKDTAHPEENQDAYGLDADAGVAVVADGVSSALFSRQWAWTLAEAVLAEPPEVSDAEALAAWIGLRREKWSGQIDTGGLAWFQKAKLPMGAFSTLLWVRLLPVQQPQDGQFGAMRLLAYAMGDSCLLHIRHGQMVRSFPIQKAAELEADPLVLGSVDLGRDGQIDFQVLDEVCYADDLLVLCTDAVADWALRAIESGNPPAWDDYWTITDSQWQQEVVALRQQRGMRYDDATMLLLRVAAEDASIGRQEEPPTESEEDWKEKFASASQQFAEGVELASGQVARGWKKWKDKAVKKVRDKFQRDD